MKRDRLLRIKSLMKIISLEHLAYGIDRCQLDDIRECHRIKPRGIAAYFKFIPIENLTDLLHVGLAIAIDLFLSKHRSRFLPAGRIADHSRKITNDECRLMP